MKILKLLSSYLLPKETNFFLSLCEQADACLEIARAFLPYLDGHSSRELEIMFSRLDESVEKRKYNLSELHLAFITPVDKETISRCYNQLYLTELSFKHLAIEIKTYERFDISLFQEPFTFIIEVIIHIRQALQEIEHKNFEKAISIVEEIYSLNDRFSHAYAKQLNELFKKEDNYSVNVNREVLVQFKSIMNHCINCANQISDIIFKLS